MAVTNTPAQNRSNIGRGWGDKHINRATDEVLQNDALLLLPFYRITTRKKPVSLVEL